MIITYCMQLLPPGGRVGGNKLPGASLALDGGRDRSKPAGRADALRVGAEAGPVTRSHGNSLDSNLDTFVLTQPGRSGRRGQGVSAHRAEIGPPPVHAQRSQ